ncbi:MAG: acyltransferase family protein [Verrucomicrobiota bacterium]
MSEGHSLNYRPEIDGLRCLAVLAVLAFHADLGFPGGFAGVDVFFVISGFLIGSIIAREIEENRFSIFRFWERRIRRLFPALAVVLLATVLVCVLVFIPIHLKGVGGALMAQPVFAANFFFWSETGYFDTANENQPLLHTWSLAVEEQFYLLLPLVLLLVMKKGRLFALKIVLLFLFVSFLWSVYSSPRYPSSSYYLLPSRIWELDLGVVLALIKPVKLGRRATRWISWLGLAFILGSFFVLEKSMAFPGWIAAIPCLGTAMILFAHQSTGGAAASILSNRVVVGIGKISYPLYLWHWPCLVFVNYLHFGQAPVGMKILALLISFLLSWLTYRFVETPVRKRRILRGGKSLVLSALALSLLLVGIGYALEAGILRKPGKPGGEMEWKVEIGVPGIPALEDWGETEERIRFGSEEKTDVEFLVWGDSHSLAMTSVLDDLGKEYGISLYSAWQQGDPPILDVASRKYPQEGKIFDERVRLFIEKRNFAAAFLVARWPIYVEGTPAGSTGFSITPPSVKWDRRSAARTLFEAEFADTVEFLQDKGIDVYVVANVGYQPVNVPEAMEQLHGTGRSVNSFAVPLAYHREQNRKMMELLQNTIEGSGVTFLDPLPYLTDKEGIYLLEKDGRPLYSDRSHLSPFGSRQVEDLFVPVFRKYSEGSVQP